MTAEEFRSQPSSASVPAVMRGDRMAASHVGLRTLTSALAQRERESSISGKTELSVMSERESINRDAALLRWLDTQRTYERVNEDLDGKMAPKDTSDDGKSDAEIESFDDALAMLTAAI